MAVVMVVARVEPNRHGLESVVERLRACQGGRVRGIGGLTGGQGARAGRRLPVGLMPVKFRRHALTFHLQCLSYG